jgi:SAM-dependent methyltransferase
MNKLNFGCGNDIKDGWDNVDIQRNSKMDKRFDFNKFPYPLKKDYYDLIYISNVLEHLEKPDEVLYELWKSCKNKGIIHIIVPYYNSRGAYNDMAHMHFFSGSTFRVFIDDPNRVNDKKMFEIQYMILRPSRIGRMLPEKLREKLSLFIGGLISQVNVKLKVIK